MTLTSILRRSMLPSTALLASVALFALAPRSFAETARPVPAPVMDETAPKASSETAIVAGGCFWGVQGVFQHVKGVTSAVSGYAGGERATAQYDEVSTGTTGHAESVKIIFDPRQISYGKLLQIYFSAVHNPTEHNRQGPDTGTQYRSAIFPTNAEQARVAQAYKEQINAANVFGRPIATKIEPGKAFFPAEDHHQDFLARNPNYPYIAINDLPKVDALKAMYPDLYRPQAVLVAGTSAGE